jgi:hypothetical protein
MHLFKVYIIQFLTGMIYIRPWPYGQNSLEYDYIFTHYSKIEQLEQRIMVGCFFYYEYKLVLKSCMVL